MTQPVPLPTEILEFWSYDPQTGNLFWKKRRSVFSKVRVGDQVPLFKKTPKKSKKPYFIVKFAGHWYLAHRVAWFLATGKQPDGFIDHIDNDDTLNNRLENLRVATNSQNAANAKGRGKRDLPKGVFKTPSGNFLAYIRVNGKRIALGTYETPETAHQAYVEAAKLHFGEFARAA